MPARSREDSKKLPSVADAERLLFLEARLLDDRRYEEWLDLFTEDGIYWIPMNGGEDGTNPGTSISIVYDDSERRAERVYRTLHTPVLDQSPPSRTIHVVSNVEVDAEPIEGAARVWCAQLIAEMRPGGPGQAGLGDPRWFAARCEYRLKEIEGEWRIALKRLVLIDSDRPLYNLTFVV